MTYLEKRRHELRKRRILMVDGNLTQNSLQTEVGHSARVYANGYWGFAASHATDSASVAGLTDQAKRNAETMARFGAKSTHHLPAAAHKGHHVYAGKAAWSQAQAVDKLKELHAWAKARYPDLVSMRFILTDEHHSKHVTNSLGSDALNSIQRAAFGVFLTALNDEGKPVELYNPLSCKGSVADLDWSAPHIEAHFDELYNHLQAKRHAVAARGGQHTILLAPALAGMLAHEAMGHPCEADIVMGGAVTGNLMGQRVGSDLITMIDAAHSFRGQEAMVPVYSDDEGTPAHDAVLIHNGMLTGFMHSRETSAQMNQPTTGSARAYLPSDEPLIRMRNTVIVPGNRNYADMLAEVDDGYVILMTGNGQADTTTEFMFSVSLGYEVKNGKLGRAIKDTTLSGSAIKVLQSCDAVSNDLHWTASGYCGKKQPMVVSMGGPALRVRAHLGGE